MRQREGVGQGPSPCRFLAKNGGGVMGDFGRDGWDAHWPSDADMLGRAVRNAGVDGVRPRWSIVADRLAVGSSVATALCRRFGVNPDEIQKRKR